MVGAKLHGNCKIEYFSSELATAFLMGSNNIWSDNPGKFALLQSSTYFLG